MVEQGEEEKEKGEPWMSALLEGEGAKKTTAEFSSGCPWRFISTRSTRAPGPMKASTSALVTSLGTWRMVMEKEEGEEVDEVELIVGVDLEEAHSPISVSTKELKNQNPIFLIREINNKVCGISGKRRRQAEGGRRSFAHKSSQFSSHQTLRAKTI